MAREEPHFVYGHVTRELWELFNRHAGSTNVLSYDSIKSALNEAEIFPSRSQVYELVHCACECSGRTPVDHVTFGEFCVVVTELRELYRKCPSPPHPRSQVRDKRALEERRKKRRLSGHANFKVFLGGSCNPTTWRHDKVIPILKQHGITFYNPQVTNWRSELMEIEDQAKQTAELLFFVIDNVTRSTASMVEASYLAGCGRQLILIIKAFNGPGDLVANEPITDFEYEDLERSHAFLTDMVERQGIPVFHNIDVALECTTKAVEQNVSINELGLADGVQPVKFAHVRFADNILHLKNAYNAVDTTNSGKLSFADVNLAYRSITAENLPAEVHQDDGVTYSFQDFCCLVSEFKYKRKPFLRRILASIGRIPIRLTDWLRGTSMPSSTDEELIRRQRDVFLGGTCGSSSWREDAIAALRKQGLSYYNPQIPDWSTRYIPLEAAVKDSCRLLLFVISPDTRGITSMLEAGHYIGLGCDIVLCVQHIEEGSTIDGEQLTDLAVKDYNRARAYLADLANRDGVPVFDNIKEAVGFVVQKLSK